MARSPVLNQPSLVKDALLASGLSKYPGKTELPRTWSSPSVFDDSTAPSSRETTLTSLPGAAGPAEVSGKSIGPESRQKVAPAVSVIPHN